VQVPVMERLSASGRRLQRLRQQHESEVKLFETLVVDAHREGHSVRTIAAAAGLSHARIGQIIRKAKH
jgi:hypothetical protein